MVKDFEESPFDIRAAVFDLDGLLVNTEELYQDVGTDLLRRRGKTFDAELLDDFQPEPPEIGQPRGESPHFHAIGRGLQELQGRLRGVPGRGSRGERRAVGGDDLLQVFVFFRVLVGLVS